MVLSLCTKKRFDVPYFSSAFHRTKIDNLMEVTKSLTAYFEFSKHQNRGKIKKKLCDFSFISETSLFFVHIYIIMEKPYEDIDS